MNNTEVNKIIEKINNSEQNISDSVKSILFNENKDISHVIGALVVMLQNASDELSDLSELKDKEMIDELKMIQESDLYLTYKLAKKTGCEIQLLVE